MSAESEQNFYITFNGNPHQVESMAQEVATPGYEFQVVAGRFRDTETSDYAIGHISANGTSPIQLVHRSEPISDYPWHGTGTCISFNPDTQVLSILSFDEQNPGKNQYMRQVLGQQPKIILQEHPQIHHQQGDYVIWIAGSESLTLYDICNQRPFKPGDLIDLDPINEEIPEEYIQAITPYLPPQSHLSQLLKNL